MFNKDLTFWHKKAPDFVKSRGLFSNFFIDLRLIFLLDKWMEFC